MTFAAIRHRFLGS